MLGVKKDRNLWENFGPRNNLKPMTKPAVPDCRPGLTNRYKKKRTFKGQ